MPLNVKIKSNLSKTSYIGYFSRVIRSVISDYSYVGNFSVINSCNIGKFCSISEGVKIGMGEHPTNFLSTSPLFYSKKSVFRNNHLNRDVFIERKKTIIGNDVHIGANVFIKDGLNIGDGSIVGAGAIVTSNVRPYEIVGGVPSKVIRKRFSDGVIERILNLDIWSLESDKILELTPLLSKELDEENLKQLENIIPKLRES